jgi:hypothetical protein
MLVADEALDLRIERTSEPMPSGSQICERKPQINVDLGKAFVDPRNFQSVKRTRRPNLVESHSVVTSEQYLATLEAKKLEKEEIERKKAENKERRMQKRIDNEAKKIQKEQNKTKKTSKKAKE